MSFQLDSRIPLGFQGYNPEVGQRNALLRLQMQAAERDLDEQNALRGVLDRAGGGLSADDPAKRAAAAAELAQVGPRGYQIAAPILTGVRNERQISQIMGGGGAPARGRGATPGGDVLTRIAAAESGGNDAARNPRSSAAGRFQIIDSTWSSYAPRLGLRPDQRMDPAAQEQVARAIQADAQQAVGRPLNPGEQYAAHFLGVGGLRAFLSADPNADAQQVYAQAAGPGVAWQAFASNPGLLEPGATVGQTLQRISARVGGGGGAPDAAARPSAPGQPTPAQFAQLVQAAAAGNDVAQRLVQAWAPFMRQESAPEPLERIRLPDGSERLVPRREAAGMVSAPSPQAGSEGERMRSRYIDLDSRRGTLNQREAQELALIERQMTMPQTLVDTAGGIRVIQPPPLPRGGGDTGTVPLSASGEAPAGASDARPAAVPSGTRTPATTEVPGGATVTTIPGQRPAQPLDGTTRRDLVDLGGRLSTLGRLTQSFNDRYGGYAVSGVGQAVAAAGRVFGDTSGMSQWWQDYQEFKNIIRNQLFGAALTATEKAEFDRAAVNPGMAPSQIRQNLARQVEIAQGVARRQAQTLVNDNFNPESVASALGLPLEQIGAARDPAMQPGPGGRGVASPPPPPPRAGDVQDGYRFRGGDPSRRESWERVR